MKKLITLAALVALTGCAAPAFRNPATMNDAELCAAVGYHYTAGNTERLIAVTEESKRRIRAGSPTMDYKTCDQLSAAGANLYFAEQEQARERKAETLNMQRLQVERQAAAAAMIN
ncbi:hypothetical protein CUW27_20715 [Salmonella enterica]|nr:hypothetical protein [Salmonella enterica]